MNTVDIYGLFLGPDNLPTMESLAHGYDNREHANLIDLARNFYQEACYYGKYFAAIVVICGGHMTTYTVEDFRRR